MTTLHSSLEQQIEICNGVPLTSLFKGITIPFIASTINGWLQRLQKFIPFPPISDHTTDNNR